MGKYGINVPKGVAVASVEEVRKVVKDVFPNEKEVLFCFFLFIFLLNFLYV